MPAGQIAAIPAVAEDDPDGVLAGYKRSAEIVLADIDPFAVVGPAGRKHIVVNAMTIALRFV